MPTVTSNHGCCLTDLDAAAVDKKGFKMEKQLFFNRIREIYTLRFKNVLFRPFQPILRHIGRADPIGTRDSLRDFILVDSICHTDHGLFHQQKQPPSELTAPFGQISLVPIGPARSI